MSTAAAKRKLISIETRKAAEESRPVAKGLWVDLSKLPTNLAKNGSRKNPLLNDRQPHFGEENRILVLADIALGLKKSCA
jgi:hypothetical protein